MIPGRGDIGPVRRVPVLRVPGVHEHLVLLDHRGRARLSDIYLTRIADVVAILLQKLDHRELGIEEVVLPARGIETGREWAVIADLHRTARVLRAAAPGAAGG